MRASEEFQATPFQARSFQVKPMKAMRAEIDMAHIRVGGGFAGLIFAAATVTTFCLGIPALQCFLAGAAATGVGISVGLQLFHAHRPLQALPSIRA